MLAAVLLAPDRFLQSRSLDMADGGMYQAENLRYLHEHLLLMAHLKICDSSRAGCNIADSAICSKPTQLVTCCSAISPHDEYSPDKTIADVRLRQFAGCYDRKSLPSAKAVHSVQHVSAHSDLSNTVRPSMTTSCLFVCVAGR